MQCFDFYVVCLFLPVCEEDAVSEKFAPFLTLFKPNIPIFDPITVGRAIENGLFKIRW